MQQYRSGEEGYKLPLRSDRFFKLQDDWYFQVRGGACFGPYCCRGEAARAARQLFGTKPKPKPVGGAEIHPFGSLRARRWRQQFRN